MNKKHYIVMAVYALVVLVIGDLYAEFDIAQREKFIRVEVLMDETHRWVSKCQRKNEKLTEDRLTIVIPIPDGTVLVDIRCMLDW